MIFKEMKMSGSSASTLERVQLLEPLKLREVTLKNRIVVSAMSMYSSHDGFSDDFHLVHLGRFALGGAGLVFVEATAVNAQGRITPGCNGLWRDEQIANLKRITAFLRRFNCASGIQLAHSGWKGSVRRPWHGGTVLNDEDVATRGERPWKIVSASSQPFDASSPPAVAFAEPALDGIMEDFRSATRRANDAEFDITELHCGHGYLLHSFLSPLANTREDRYGGSLENRMRFPLDVATAIRAVWPRHKPIFVRISAVDGIGIGWSIEDSVVFAKALADRGIDLIDCSTGGMKLPREKNLVARTPGFQVPFAAQIRREAHVPTMAVGLILDPHHAEAILESGDADLIAIGREMLVNPNFAVQAALELQGESGWQLWIDQYRWWLERRARQLRNTRASIPSEGAARIRPIHSSNE
jgi:2,4-dienoyl-CoA reductase-like NADH-dependent reductase (Old Yellow Enzyme family)